MNRRRSIIIMIIIIISSCCIAQSAGAVEYTGPPKRVSWISH